jgi:hypothetical protein
VPCATCPAGTFLSGCDGVVAGLCVACAAGSFSATSGHQKTACDSCAVGKFSSANTSTACLNCAVGTFCVFFVAFLSATCRPEILTIAYNVAKEPSLQPTPPLHASTVLQIVSAPRWERRPAWRVLHATKASFALLVVLVMEASAVLV